MTPWTPLWAADVGEVIGYVVFILVVVVSVIAQMANKARQQQQPQRGRGPVQGGPQGGGPQGGGPAQAGNVEDEIGDFLRRAAERRGGAPAPQALPRANIPVAAEAVEEPMGGQLREHVGEYLDSSKFERRASELGDEVSQADEMTQQRLHQKFDHEVSRLAGRPGESAEPLRAVGVLEPEDRTGEFPPTAAVGVAAMLRDVESIRQAIIISEILNRPQERWV